MELKVVCNCGQKFKFDVVPVNGLMPFTVNCPVCGLDGTPSANTLIGQLGPQPPPLPPPLPAAAPVGTRLAAGAAGSNTGSGHRASPRPAAIRPAVAAPMAKVAGQFNLGLGIAGAFAGAAIGSGLMYGFFEMTQMRFPLIGVGTGVLTGMGARLLGKGSDQTLGIISAVLALGSVVGTLFLMYGADFPVLNIISVLVSASVAYKTANR